MCAYRMILWSETSVKGVCFCRSKRLLVNTEKGSVSVVLCLALGGLYITSASATFSTRGTRVSTALNCHGKFTETAGRWPPQGVVVDPDAGWWAIMQLVWRSEVCTKLCTVCTQFGAGLGGGLAKTAPSSQGELAERLLHRS